MAADEGEDLDGVLEDVLGGRGRLGGLGQDEQRGALRLRVRATPDALHQQVGVDHAGNTGWSSRRLDVAH